MSDRFPAAIQIGGLVPHQIAAQAEMSLEKARAWLAALDEAMGPDVPALEPLRITP